MHLEINASPRETTQHYSKRYFVTILASFMPVSTIARNAWSASCRSSNGPTRTRYQALPDMLDGITLTGPSSAKLSPNRSAKSRLLNEAAWMKFRPERRLAATRSVPLVDHPGLAVSVSVPFGME